MTVRIEHGDCIEIMRNLASEGVRVDAIVTDPPYHFGSIVKRWAKTDGGDRVESRVGAFTRHAKGFMGKEWDGGDLAFQWSTWQLALLLLKPGGHLVAFGGTKGFHRMACAVEDAGAEIRDTIMWLYGSGFPKSHNQDGEWAGWGTALKPAFEPIILAQRPLDGSVAENLARHGVGALNIDGCRVEGPMDGVWGTSNKTVNRERMFNGSPSMDEYRSAPHANGRWPANVIHDGSDEVLAAFPDALGAIAATPTREIETNVAYGSSRRGGGMEPRADSGSAARFFYCAKASRADRDAGCEGFAKKPLHWSSGDQSPGTFQSAGTEKKARNNHPTVKPTALMRYLCRLVTPLGGLILDPFMGSGSTGRGALLEGFRFIGIEREAEYVDIARARIADAQKDAAA